MPVKLEVHAERPDKDSGERLPLVISMECNVGDWYSPQLCTQTQIGRGFISRPGDPATDATYASGDARVWIDMRLQPGASLTDVSALWRARAKLGETLLDLCAEGTGETGPALRPRVIRSACALAAQVAKALGVKVVTTDLRLGHYGQPDEVYKANQATSQWRASDWETEAERIEARLRMGVRPAPAPETEDAETENVTA